MAASETTRRVRDELALLRAADGQLPGPDQHPAELLAQASLPHYADDQVFYLDPDPAVDGPESPKCRAEGPASAWKGAVTQVKFIMWLFWAAVAWFVASIVVDKLGGDLSNPGVFLSTVAAGAVAGVWLTRGSGEQSN
jgi:hypothetical protein